MTEPGAGRDPVRIGALASGGGRTVGNLASALSGVHAFVKYAKVIMIRRRERLASSERRAMARHTQPAE